MSHNNILELFRVVGASYTYASLAGALDVSAATVRGYLTGFIRPSHDRQYQRMRLVVTAHEEGIAESALDLKTTRGTGRFSFEPRADRSHLLDCGRAARKRGRSAA